MFVEQERFRRNPKSILFTIRNRPLWVSNSERIASPILDRSCSPTAGVPHTKLFDMQEGKNFVTKDAECVPVTPAQKALLELLSHPNAPDYSEFLKEIHELGTYYPDKDLVNLQASLHVHWLQEAVAAIASEHFTNSKYA